VIDHLRIRHREVPTDLGPDGEAAVEPDHFDDRGRWQQPVSAWGSPDGALRQDQFLETLESCIEDLPRRSADAFRLRELHGLETDEICEVLGVSTSGNLFVILSRARMQLRDCLGIHWFEGEKRPC
jgi:RNA polymerase sigma-70 factor (ECF subfamily)